MINSGLTLDTNTNAKKRTVALFEDVKALVGLATDYKEFKLSRPFITYRQGYPIVCEVRKDPSGVYLTYLGDPNKKYGSIKTIKLQFTQLRMGADESVHGVHYPYYTWGQWDHIPYLVSV